MLTNGEPFHKATISSLRLYGKATILGNQSGTLGPNVKT